jgi:integrase
MVGSKTLNTQEKELHEVISSHSGRRSYIKNLIDLGEMDYKSIMKLSGHRSITEFLKYVSVNEEDLKKGSNLYRLENKTEDEEVEEVVKIYKSLQEEEKVMIRTILDRFKK